LGAFYSSCSTVKVRRLLGLKLKVVISIVLVSRGKKNVRLYDLNQMQFGCSIVSRQRTLDAVMSLGSVRNSEKTLGNLGKKTKRGGGGSM